ncbi:MAG: hypothetical protein ACRDRH_02450 [Pseudonocardia sp.]
MPDALTDTTGRAADALTSPSQDTAYQQVETAYTTALRAEVGTAVTVTKKWPNEDLLWPHSDLDLRIVLDEALADWVSFNDGLARVHRRVLEADPVRRRVLEHPPGWVFLRSELDRGLVPAAEVATWSSSGGDPAALQAWQIESGARPWGGEDERFYRGILGGRTGGRYRLAADSADNVVTGRERYGVHCVVWHFLAPVLFAHTALVERRRPAGKSAVLGHHPNPQVRDMYHAATAAHPAVTDPDRLLDQVTQLVDTLRPISAGSDQDNGPTRAELVSALGVLRCRIARYGYYLDPPADVATGYLIDRESKDLYAATSVLAAAAPMFVGETRRVINRFLDLVPAPPTNRASLGAFMQRLRADPGLVEALSSLALGDPEPSR